MRDEIESVEVRGFQLLHIDTNPQRLEGRVVLERDDISQKLIFTLMEICHQHGFGCSPPQFFGPEDPHMIFIIGTFLPSSRSVNKYSNLLCDCLEEVEMFIDEFYQQLDFSLLDLSMFIGMDLMSFSPEQIAGVRDQHFDGSWREFKKALNKEDKKEELDLVKRCIKFEKVNDKDIGFVGHKLSNLIYMLEEADIGSGTN